MKNILLFLTFCFTVSLNGQSICEFNEMETFYKAYTLNSVALWEKAIDNIKQQPNFENDKEAQLQLAYANYGLAGNCMGSGNKERGIKATEDGEMYSMPLLDDEKYGSEAYAVLSGIYGLQIAFNPMKGMSLGSKSDKYVAKAIELDDKNAFAYLQKGSSLFNTPKMFGGSVKKSVAQFEKAISIYEAQDLPMNLWEIEAKVWLGQAYEELDELQKAKGIYEDVLEQDPNFGWVKSYLLPRLEAKL